MTWLHVGCLLCARGLCLCCTVGREIGKRWNELEADAKEVSLLTLAVLFE